MDTETLRTMLLLARTKNFSQTAGLMNVVQSTVSARIAELEHAVGRKLFLRSNRAVSLTESGRFFLSYAEKVVNDFDNGIAMINSLDFFRERLVIGSVYSALPNLLLPVYQDFLQTHPDISIKTIAGHSSDILQSLAGGMIDCAVSYQATKNSRFSSWICHEEDFVLAVPADGPLAVHDSYLIEELSTLNLLYHNWGGTFTDWFSRIVPGNRWFRATIGNPSFVLSLVEAGIGPAILTRSTVTMALQRGTVKALTLVGHPLPPRWFTYFCASTRQISCPAMQRWIEAMGRHGLPLLPL